MSPSDNITGDEKTVDTSSDQPLGGEEWTDDFEQAIADRPNIAGTLRSGVLGYVRRATDVSISQLCTFSKIKKFRPARDGEEITGVVRYVGERHVYIRRDIDPAQRFYRINLHAFTEWPGLSEGDRVTVKRTRKADRTDVLESEPAFKYELARLIKEDQRVKRDSAQESAQMSIARQADAQEITQSAEQSAAEKIRQLKASGPLAVNIQSPIPKGSIDTSDKKEQVRDVLTNVADTHTDSTIISADVDSATAHVVIGGHSDTNEETVAMPILPVMTMSAQPTTITPPSPLSPPITLLTSEDAEITAPIESSLVPPSNTLQSLTETGVDNDDTGVVLTASTPIVPIGVLPVLSASGLESEPVVSEGIEPSSESTDLLSNVSPLPTAPVDLQAGADEDTHDIPPLIVSSSAFASSIPVGIVPVGSDSDDESEHNQAITLIPSFPASAPLPSSLPATLTPSGAVIGGASQEEGGDVNIQSSSGAAVTEEPSAVLATSSLPLDRQLEPSYVSDGERNDDVELMYGGARRREKMRATEEQGGGEAAATEAISIVNDDNIAPSLYTDIGPATLSADDQLIVPYGAQGGMLGPLVEASKAVLPSRFATSSFVNAAYTGLDTSTGIVTLAVRFARATGSGWKIAGAGLDVFDSFRVGHFMASSDMPLGRKIPLISGYVVGSQLIDFAVRQNRTLFHMLGFNVPYAQSSGMGSNYDIAKTVMFYSAPAVAGYLIEQWRDRDDKQSLTIELAAREKRNVNTLFADGRRGYRDQLVKHIAEFIAPDGEEVPADISHDNMQFFEDRGVREIVDKIINEGEAGNRQAFDKALRDISLAVNKKISADELKGFPLIGEYLAKPNSELCQYLLNRFPEVFFSEELVSFKQTSNLIIKGLQQSSEGRSYLADAKAKVNSSENAGASIDLPTIQKDLKTLHSSVIKMLELMKKNAGTFPYSMKFRLWSGLRHDHVPEGVESHLNQLQQIEHRATPKLMRVIQAYFAAYPTMEREAKANGVEVSEIGWQPLGAKEQNSKTPMNVVGKSGSAVCLKASPDNNESSGNFVFVTMGTAQLATAGKPKLHRNERVYINRDRDASPTLSIASVSWREVWKQGDINLRLLLEEILAALTIQRISREKLRWDIGFTNTVSDLQSQITKAMDTDLAAWGDRVSRALEEIDHAFDTLKDKKLANDYRRLKGYGNDMLTRLRTEQMELAQSIASREMEVLELDILRYEKDKNPQLAAGILEKYDYLAGRADIWQRLNVEPSVTATILEQVMKIRYGRLRKGMRSPAADTTLQVVDALVKNQDQLIELNGRAKQEALISKRTRYEDIAIVCHAEAALQALNSVELGSENTDQVASINEAVLTAVKLIKEKFSQFDSESGGIIVRKKLSAEDSKIIFNTLSDMFSQLSRDMSALASGVESSPVKTALKKASREIETIGHYVDSRLAALPNGVHVDNKSRLEILEKYDLVKFSGQSLIDTEEQVEKKLQLAEDSESANEAGEDQPEMPEDEEGVAADLKQPDTEKQNRKARQKEAKLRRRAEREKAALETAGAPVIDDTAAQSAVSSGVIRQFSAVRSRTTQPKAEVVPKETKSAEDFDQEITRLKRELANEQKHADALISELDRLDNTPALRDGMKKETLSVKIQAMLKALETLVSLHSQINNIYVEVTDSQLAVKWNGTLEAANHRSEREKCRGLAKKYRGLGETWYQEKIQTERQKIKRDLAYKPLANDLRLLPNSAIQNVDCRVLPNIPQLTKYNPKTGHFEPQFDPRTNMPLYDHVLSRTIQLGDGLSTVAHTHYFLTTHEPVSKEDLLRDHQANRGYSSLQTESDAKLGRTGRARLGLGRKHRDELSARDVDRLEYLEVIKPILSNPKFTLSDGMRKMLEDAMDPGKNILSKEALRDLERIAEQYKNKTCRFEMWGDIDPRQTGPSQSGLSQVSNRPALEKGAVIAGDEHSQLCLIDPLGSMQTRPSKNVEVFYFAMRASVLNAVKNETVTYKKGELTKGHQGTGATPNVANVVQKQRRG